MISFLLGSGFSIPEGINSVSDLNKRLKAIKASEIEIQSDLNAYFASNKDGIHKRAERLFIEKFLSFYNNEVLEDENFHYEDFYDYYNSFLREGKNRDEIEAFCEDFNSELHELETKFDADNRVRNFDTTFNQLLGSLLNDVKYYRDVSMSDYWRYNNFIKFLRKCLQEHEIKIHSLNHDLLFDHIGKKTTGLWEHFCDGFELNGSKFYGSLRWEFEHNGQKIPKQYKVKLERFTGSFTKRLALFKLHGSVDNYIAYELNPKIRLRRDYAITEFFIEHKPKGEDQLIFSRLADSIKPDFLSGTTAKINKYENPYYEILFEHFTKNLRNSDSLIIIGYGFKDIGINKFIKDEYLSRSKKMIVIDVKEPNEKFIDPNSYMLIKKSIEKVSPDEINDLL